MPKVLLLHLDGSLPNVALMRLAAHHRGAGDGVELREVPDVESAERGFWDSHDVVYASAIFEKTRPVVDRVRRSFPGAVVGGTGVDLITTLESIGVHTRDQDYSVYPGYRQSIGFTQRGCRLKCSFCVVPRKEGRVRKENTVPGLWRGEPWPRELVLLDNDFFGEPDWRDRVKEIRDGEFKVAFSQGINARALDDETAAAIASVDYRDNDMGRRRVYTAWDNRGHEKPLFRGLNLLAKHGVKPRHIMVYVLVGYDHDSAAARPHLTDDDFHRVRTLRAFGADPYPMPFVRNPELVGFQRWVVPGYDKRVAWGDWVRAGYEPRKLGRTSADQLNGQRKLFN